LSQVIVGVPDWFQNGPWGFCGIGWNLTRICVPLLRTHHQHNYICTWWLRCCGLMQGVPFWGFCWHCYSIMEQNPSKPHPKFWECEEAFSSQTC